MKGYELEMVSVDKDCNETVCPYCGYNNINEEESDLCEHFSSIIDEGDYWIWEFTCKKSN